MSWQIFSVSSSLRSVSSSLLIFSCSCLSESVVDINDDEEDDEGEEEEGEVRGGGEEVRVEAGTTTTVADEDEEEEDEEEEEEEDEDEEEEEASFEIAGAVTTLLSDVADSIRPSGRANRMHTMWSTAATAMPLDPEGCPWQGWIRPLVAVTSSSMLLFDTLRPAKARNICSKVAFVASILFTLNMTSFILTPAMYAGFSHTEKSSFLSCCSFFFRAAAASSATA